MTTSPTKPPAMEVRPDNIPKDLCEGIRWVVWRLEHRPDKNKKKPWTKPSYQPTGKPASVIDPITWSSFDIVVTAYQGGGFDGIGRVASQEEDYTFLDLDNCRDPETRRIEDWTLDIIKKLNSYRDFSPTGTGLRINVQAVLPPGDRKKGDFECYDKARYLTLTGWHIAGTSATIEPRQAEVEALHREIFGIAVAPSKRQESYPVELEHLELVDKAKAAKNGGAFTKGWVGDWQDYQSQSEADLALVNHLAFWTGGDGQRMDQLFRQSCSRTNGIGGITARAELTVRPPLTCLCPA